MAQIKRKLAMILCIILLVSMLPAAALADGGTAEVVGYNLGRFTVFVGSDPAQLETGEVQALFAEDGSYTIELEENAYFPYQLKLTSETEEEIVWFSTPEDTVEFAGHSFSVHSENTDPTAITQIGVTIDGTYIPAYPEEKNFRPMLLRSMMPLREVRNLSLDLSGYLPAQLENLPVQTVIEALAEQQSIQIEDDVAVYAKWNYYDEEGNIVNENDNFVLVDDTLNLTDNMPSYYSSDSFTLELLVGTADQLNLDNVRYIIRVSVNSAMGLFLNMVQASGVNAERKPLTFVRFSPSMLTSNDGTRSPLLNIYFDDKDEFSNRDVRISFSFLEGVTGWTARVVEGLYSSAADVPADAVDITSQIWDANLSAEGGYLGDMRDVTFLLTQNDAVQTIPVKIWITPQSRIGLNNLFVRQNQYNYSSVYSSSSYSKSGDPAYRHYRLELHYGIPADEEYLLCLRFYGDSNSSTGREYVTGAYVGHYKSASAIPAEAENIADKLFSSPYESNSGYLANFSEGVEFTIVDLTGELHWFYVEAEESTNPWHGLDYSLYSGDGKQIGSRYSWSYGEPMRVRMSLNSDAATAADCLLRVSADVPYAQISGMLEKIVLGDYASADAIPANAENIAEQLFGNGYPVGFDSTVYLTALDKKGNVSRLEMEIPEAPEAPITGTADDPLSEDTYFRVYSVSAPDGSLSTWIMPHDADSYYYNGYQTALVMKYDYNNVYGYSPVASGSVIPYFTTGENVKMYAGVDKAGGDPQFSGETEIPFSSGSVVQYSAASEDAGHLKNYWVTFLTQQSGPKLFVNATNDEGRYVTVDDGQGNETSIPSREMFITDAFGNKHDIFFANIGDEDITGLYARLEDPSGVKLDDFWRIGETTTLSAFRTTQTRDADGHYVSYGELANVGKIRLLPITNEDGSIDFQSIAGTLVIGYDSNGDSEPEEEVRIKLTGIVGDLAINTETIADGVKYVPYSQLIQTNNMYADDAVTFEISDGVLPTGVTLRERTGELYGLPTEVGSFTFTVKAVAQYGARTFTAEKEFTVEIKDNTDENVANASDEGYHVWTTATEEHPRVTSEELANRKVEEFKDLLFVSEGNFAEFVAFYVDGVKQGEGSFVAEEGSAIILILEETLRTAGVGQHTLAIEFRNSGTASDTVYSPMHKTVQNYVADDTAVEWVDDNDDNYYEDYTPTPNPPAPQDTFTEPEDGPIALEYEVRNGEAEVKSISAAREAALNAERNPDAIIDLSAETDVDSVLLPADVVETLAEKLSDSEAQTGALTIEFPDASLVLDETAMRAIKDQAGSDSVKITVETLDESDLNEAQQAALEDREPMSILRVTVTAGARTIESFDGGRLAVQLAFTPEEDLNGRDVSVFYLNKEGQLLRHATDYADKRLSFRTTHFSDYVVLKDTKVDFSDVADGKWYAGVVDYAARSGLMNGMGNQMFAPEAKLTRAMMAQILYNFEEKPTVSGSGQFKDVAANAWYADAVNWAAEVGIVKGVGDGRFAPNVEITREQLALMMYNFAAYKGYSVARSASTGKFADSADISAWAQTAFEWALGEKLFCGTDENTLLPASNATRAQTAKVLAYFLEGYVL